MTSFFLGCFAFGLIFTVASFVLGGFGATTDVDLPDAPLGGLDGADQSLAGLAGHGHGAHISPFSFSTLSAFLAWFGGAGWLLVRYSDLTALLIIILASFTGLVGGGIVFVTLARYVVPRLTEMRPEDYQLTGVTARVTSAIAAGGTGEIVYSLAGTRRVDGARSVNGEALEHGAEVVVLKVEKGIAYVQRWAQFADTNQLPPGDTGAA